MRIRKDEKQLFPSRLDTFKKHVRGVFYIKTNSQNPFCLRKIWTNWSVRAEIFCCNISQFISKEINVFVTEPIVKCWMEVYESLQKNVCQCNGYWIQISTMPGSNVLRLVPYRTMFHLSTPSSDLFHTEKNSSFQKVQTLSLEIELCIPLYNL